MSEKQSETAVNPETDQVDGGQVRPHPEMAIDGEFQPRDAGHLQYEAADIPDRNSRGTGRLSDESRQVQPNPAAEEGAPDSHSDTQSAIREPSDGDKMRNSAENPESSGILERMSVGDGPLPSVRRERDPVQDIGVGNTAYFVVHDNRASVDVHCESGGVGERNPMDSGQSKTHDPLEKHPGRPTAIKGRGGTRCLGEDGLAATSSSDLEQGYSSDSLLLPDARKKGRSHAVAKGIRSTVWYVHATPEGRDIFEAGGEESHNPKLNPLLGVVHGGSDRIERLPMESSSVEESPVVETTPVTSVATSQSWTNSLGDALCHPVTGCFCTLWRPVEAQLAKAPLFYSLSVIVVFFALVAFFRKKEDEDILACLLVTVAVCIVLTIAVPRGAWAKGGDKLEGVSFFSGRPSDLCGECCGSVEQIPQPTRRHSKYYHPLEEEAHTAFEHEVADVSNIDPNDCPQMRMVEEQGFGKSESPDFPPDFRQLNVDIHAPGSPRNSEEVEVPRKQRAAKKLAKNRTRSKSKSSSAPPKLPKDSKLEEVPILQTGGQPEDLSNADLTRNIPDAPEISSTLKSTLTSLMAETATAYNIKEFVCEHDGQGVACSCFADRRKQND